MPDPCITIDQAERLREAAGLADGEGPSARKIQQATDMFVGRFEYWYLKQWNQILAKYHARVVRRVNPFIRRAQHGRCSATTLAEALVADWDSRNFVTAGGQALEALAIAVGEHCQKAIAEGVDVQRSDPENPTIIHLYTVKSGAVTRNTDIVSKMKTNLRKAERLARQSPGITRVVLNYATCVGVPTTTDADGIRRPASATFWSEVMEVDEARAILLLWGIADAGAEAVDKPLPNKRALVSMVATYIAIPGTDEVDWPFLVRVVTEATSTYRAEHKERNSRAQAAAAAVLGFGVNTDDSENLEDTDGTAEAEDEGPRDS